MNRHELDHARMQQALELAQAAIGLSDPNPRVGCVIGSLGGDILGRGHTQQAGGAHAEVVALRDAQAAGFSVIGATAWVSLEPCAHHGRTPPCCDALVAAGIARVVVAVNDPFPRVAGQGVARLRAAGIVVDHAPAGLRSAAWELNIGFFSRVLRQRPWVRLKVAASLDGRTSLDNGNSQWITGEAARTDGHAWRRRASAILTGIGTVVADDPRLDVRLVPSNGQPLRVVVDSTLRLPLNARLLQPPGAVLVATASGDVERAAALRAQGAEVLVIPADPRSGERPAVSLPALLDALAARGVNELHVEGGSRLNGSLIQAGLVDELLVYLAPKLVGPGHGMVAWSPLTSLSDSSSWAICGNMLLEGDLRLQLRRRGVHFLPQEPASAASVFFTPPLSPE